MLFCKVVEVLQDDVSDKKGVATRWRKKLQDMFVRFHMIHKRDRRTDRQTNGRTDRHRVTA